MPAPSAAVTGAVRAKALTAVVMAVTLAGALSSCSASPPAATVNGQVITQGQLDQWLEAWSSSPVYVQAFEAASAAESEEAASQGEQQPAFSVQGTGSGPGDFGLVWTTGRLSLLVSASAVHQYLERRGEAPSALEVAGSMGERVRRQPAGVGTAPGGTALEGGRASSRARSHRAEVLRHGRGQ